MDIKKSAISGTKWTTTSMAIQVGVQLLRLSVLTRFLTKADFGLVAIVTLILGFTHIFTDLGISVVLFSKHDISKKEYSSLYWVSVLSGIVLYGALFLMTPWIAVFYRLEILKQLIPIMGLDLIFATAGRQFKVFKQKELRFKEIGLIEIISSLLSLAMSIYLAFIGWGVYSLVYSTIFNSLLSSFLLIISSLKTHPISFSLHIRDNKPLYKVGLYQTGAQIFDFISSQLDIIIIGKVMGPSDLGVYNLIKQLVSRPISLINPIIQSVAIPILSKLRSNDKLFNETYLKVLNLVGLMVFPLFALLALYAEEILGILYGRSYVYATLPMQILCVWGGLSCLIGSASILVVVTGKTKLAFSWTIFRLFTNPLFIIMGGIGAAVKGISMGQSLCLTCYLILYWFFFIKKASTISFRDYTVSYIFELVITSGCFLLAVLVKWKTMQLANLYIADGLALVFFGIPFYLFNRRKLLSVYNSGMFDKRN